METPRIHYWFYHGDIANIFTVKIATTETVGDLQEAIKDKNSELRDVDAKNLNLYSLPLPDDEHIEEDLGKWTCSGKQRLTPRFKLSKCFPSDKKEWLVIVDIPGYIHYSDITLNCYVLGQDINRCFSVKILNKETVGVLKKAIKNEKQVEFCDVDADALQLYAVPNLTVENLIGTMEEFDNDKPLFTFSKLSDVFSDLLDGRVHVIVGVSASARRTTTGATGVENGISALVDDFERFMKTSSTPAPSSLAKPGAYAKFQRGSRRILDCRFSADSPADTMAPPIQLFNPAFAFFSSKAFDPAYTVDYDDVFYARGLMAEFAAIHESEKIRQTKIKSVLSTAIQRTLKSTTNSDKTSPDFVVKGSVTAFPSYLVVVEEKNEFGEGGSDPSVQATFSYQNLIRQPENNETLLRSSCPAFIIAHAGPWLSIMAGIVVGRCVVQRLTDYVWIPQHSALDDKQYLRIARILRALRWSIMILDSWYKRLDPEAALYDHRDYLRNPTTFHSRFWPSPTTYREPGTDVLVQFTYEEPLEKNFTCVTYRAKTREDDPRDIVVKFVTSYGAEPHEHMASKGFAPRLLYCGEISMPLDAPGMPSSFSYSDVRMVVMEYVNGRTLYDALKRRERIPSSFRSDLTNALQCLHGSSYVFGDLRTPNIMVLPEGTSPSTAQLIDFDWAGKDGEVTYPSAINSITIRWPFGVRELAPIEKRHDEVMLTLLMYDLR